MEPSAPPAAKPLSANDLLNPKGPYTLITFVARKPGLTETEFYDHWLNKHTAVVLPWALKHGVLSYKQCRFPSELRRKWTRATGKQGEGLGNGYDGYVEITFQDINRMAIAFKDAYYSDVVAADEDNFLDRTDERNGEAMGLGKVVGRGREVVRDGRAVV